MKARHLLFCFSAVFLVFFFRKIPIELLFPSGTFTPFAEEARKLLLNTIVIGGCFLYASKSGLLDHGGFRKPVKRNYWMLLLPLIFPGLFMAFSSENGCPLSFGLVTFAVAFTLSAAMMEEVLFRGVIQGYLRTHITARSDHTIFVYTAALFALVHFTNLETSHLVNVLPQVVFAFYIGLFFSALVYRTNNVWLVGLVHGVLNFMSTQCKQFSDINYTGPFPDLAFKDYLFQVMVMLLLLSPVLVFYWLLMKTRPRNL